MTTQAPDVFVAVDADGKATSRRVHLFENCSAVKEEATRKLSVGEVQLLGLKQCVICERRRSGGPAIDALEGFFGEDSPGDQEPRDAAWSLFSYLREHGFYLARRQPKSE